MSCYLGSFCYCRKNAGISDPSSSWFRNSAGFMDLDFIGTLRWLHFLHTFWGSRGSRNQLQWSLLGLDLGKFFLERTWVAILAVSLCKTSLLQALTSWRRWMMASVAFFLLSFLLDIFHDGWGWYHWWRSSSYENFLPDISHDEWTPKPCVFPLSAFDSSRAFGKIPFHTKWITAWFMTFILLRILDSKSTLWHDLQVFDVMKMLWEEWW